MRGATKLLGSLLDKGPADGFEVRPGRGRRHRRHVLLARARPRGSRGGRDRGRAGTARSAGGREPVRLGAPEGVLVLLLAAGAFGRHRPSLLSGPAGSSGPGRSS